MRNFKLNGTESENFKKLEKIMPRIIKRLGTKTYGIIPASVLHAYQDVIPASGLIFRCCLFTGKIKKISFLITDIQGKEKPKYRCSITTEAEERVFTFETKKKSYTQDINIDVTEGDFVEVKQVIDDTSPVLTGVHVSVLFQLEQKENEVKDQLVNNLLAEEDLTDEGI